MTTTLTRSKVLGFLMNSPGRKFTIEEIATGIQIHKTTVQRAILENRMPGIVRTAMFKRNNTQWADGYHYDEDAATAFLKASKQSTAPVETIKKNGKKDKMHKGLATNVLDIAGLPKNVREQIENGLTNLPVSGLSGIYERLMQIQQYYAEDIANPEVNDEGVRQLIMIMTGSALQRCIDIGVQN